MLSAVAAREGLTQTDLVRATGIDRSTLADLVARMIGKGLLVRERSTSDGRANAVRLSEQGLEALTEASPRAEAADHRILACLPKGKRDSFVDALHLLARAGEKAQAKVDKAAPLPRADGEAAAPKPRRPRPTRPAARRRKKPRRPRRSRRPSSRSGVPRP